jgi:hypothetical protein
METEEPHPDRHDDDDASMGMAEENVNNIHDEQGTTATTTTEASALSAKMQFSSAATTIDPARHKSRILTTVGAAADRNNDDGNDAQQQPHFPVLTAVQAGNGVEYRRVRCPPHRYTPLREHWEQILTPLVEYLKLQVRCLFRLGCRFQKQAAMEIATHSVGDFALLVVFGMHVCIFYSAPNKRNVLLLLLLLFVQRMNTSFCPKTACCSWNFKPSEKPHCFKTTECSSE